MKTNGNKNDHIVEFGNNAIMLVLALGLVLAIGTGVMHSRANANLVPSHYASAVR